jgi:hypothetical protein
MLNQKEIEILYEVQVLKFLKAMKKGENELFSKYSGTTDILIFVLSDPSLSNKIYHQAEKRFNNIYSSKEVLRDQIKKAAFKSALWWADKLDEQFDTRRCAFAENLAVIIEREMNDFTHELPFNIKLEINCDYDPDKILLEALTKSSINSKSKLFSCDGVLPRKHSLIVYSEFIEGKEGYASWMPPILL